VKNTADTFYRNMGVRLIITRLVLGLSEASAAAAHGVTLRTYRKWEAGGHHHGGHQKLLAFCKKYHVSLDWIYRDNVLKAKANLASPA
jgi:transcriptional regulator with XRE-family HTH domain